jgi:hypothetical protein
MAGPVDPRYTTKTRAKRIELDYFKRPHPFRRWRLILSVAAPLVAALWLLAHAVQGNQRMYSSGTVSTAHQMFETDCQVCHGPGPVPGAASLAPAGGGYWARVTDRACTACHAGPAHNARETFTPACASCHLEHKGRRLLVEAADQHCTQCHGSLTTKDGAPAFHQAVTALGDHPQFAVNVRPASGKLPPAGEKLARVRLDDKARADNTAMLLNHARHLKANLKGIEDVLAQQGPTGIVKLKDGAQLGCTYCHRPDDAWQYMRPVTYAEHCSVCHQLVTGIGDLVAPHVKPELVRAFARGAAGDFFERCKGKMPEGDAGTQLRERCETAGIAAAAPAAPAEDAPRGLRRGGGEAPAPAPAPEPDAPRGRRLRGALAPDRLDIVLVQDPPRGLRRRSTQEDAAPAPPAAPAEGGESSGRRLRRGGEAEAAPAAPAAGAAPAATAAWVAEQLTAAENVLFGTKGEGCQKCHKYDPDAKPATGLPEVVPPRLPARWLPHSRFDHGPHRPVACVECHKASVSSKTDDVLLPGIETCRECHRPRGGARTGCVECHRYHDKGKERDADGPYKVPQLLTGVGGSR